jgi:hypothetical protein
MKERLTKRFVKWLDQGVEYFELVEALEAAYVQMQKKEEKIKETAQTIAKLYPDYNLTEEEYMQRMGVPMITISEDGDIGFSFDTGHLYAGHTLVVSVDKEGNVKDTSLAG